MTQKESDPRTAVPMRQRVHDTIRDHIISLDWEPGLRVSEKDVAEQLGVSRSPVREAFIRLSEEGLMEIRPQSGSYVSEISFDKVYESLMLRRALEMAVAAEAAEKRTAFDLVRLNDLVADQVAASEAGDRARFFELDQQFHRALTEIARMPSAVRLIRMIRGAVDRVQRMRISRGESRHVQVIEAHRAIVDAIEARDAAAASAAMDAHLNCVELFAQIIRSPEVREYVTPRAS
ncbi:DNA-binding GntR family transcriptional regulator [Aliiruegeria haliotis]|uniref:DNA-binding GntR family transcriptional regulator n=1 Tax=Aliiruegeria haliotis TaxID=1280846 RepID=A0A2T0RZD3_9RHOB|nr:GntR family transcriptional regulator [Aliiruegeria haliotis]PRY26520.1 DNA-binding GntR family transcriptional regulator [Aliiruegeria haliotis]